ncbi:SH3 domain-containing C40 family peptidase [Exiguobacterium sp. s193]|uniref:SH3 domain-containing C40 family peptidase n=1 Tax=Exiguobacterium sp. s193 TaxID=2751207 RepID=UPI002036F8D2|nr:SH3 domain-containing C40 family peptidase [Exiguobacterium sp. s193]
MKSYKHWFTSITASVMLLGSLPLQGLATNPPTEVAEQAEQATGTKYTVSATAVFETADETTLVETLPIATAVETFGTDGLFTRISRDGVYQFVKTTELAEQPTYPKVDSQYIATLTPSYATASTETPTGKSIAQNTLVDTHGTSGAFTRIKQGDSYVFVLSKSLSKTPVYEETGNQFAQQQTAIYSDADAASKPLGSYPLNAAVKTYGTSGTFTRVQFNGVYGFVLTKHLGLKKVESYPLTGTKYAQKKTSIYEAAATGPVLGTLAFNQSVEIYGTSGLYSRVRINDTYGYVLTAHLGDSVVYAKTDRLYIQQTTPIQTEPNSSSTVLKNHQTNTLLTVYGTSGAYSRIIFRGEYAYVLTSSLAKSKVYAKTDRLYIQQTTPIQAEPNSSSTVLKNHKKNTRLTIYGTSGAYSRIIFRGEYAYVLTSSLDATKAGIYATTGTRYVTEDKVVVHPKASLSGNIGTLKKGALITTYGKSGYYTRVKVGSRFGFVDSSRLGLNKPTAKAKVGTVFYVHFNQTPLFSADVAYSRPASHLSKGTKLIGLKSIDDDFWQVRLPNGQTGYVLNPYIGTSKPDMRYNEQAINRSKVYTVKTTTSFFDTPTSPKGAGLVEQGKRVYPRYRVGNFYVIQSGWTPVYIPVTALAVTSETKVNKKNNSRGEKLIQAAVAHIGTPYTWGSQNVENGGFDCSGLIHYATNQAGKYGGRTNVRGYWYGAFFTNQRTSIGSGKRSDIVFFENTYTDGPSHIGIMLDSKHFIHAGGSQLQISSIYEPRWREHFLGFKSM